MKARLVIVFLVIILAPLMLLGWLGDRMVTEEQELLNNQYKILMSSRLNDVDFTIKRLLESLEPELMRTIEKASVYYEEDNGIDKIRRLVRTSPKISQIAVLNKEGKVLFPSPSLPLSKSEKEFLDRTRSVWDGGYLLSQVRKAEADRSSGSSQTKWSPQQTRKAASISPTLSNQSIRHGWYTWYWGNGINLLFYYTDPSGKLIAAEISRIRLLADIISTLPTTKLTDSILPDARIRLLDSRDNRVYEWGGYQIPQGTKASAERSLTPPLEAWKLEYYSTDREFESILAQSKLVQTLAPIVVSGIFLLGLGLYFYRENNRELTEAKEKVNFVNQVSHEFKTPLTNIRMYAELLENEISNDQSKASQQLGVIVSESQRLSRLIQNVLTFARGQRKKVTLRPSKTNINALVEALLDEFRPSYDAKGIVTKVSSNLADDMWCDADALRQILGNLLSNVEKYAAAGGRLDLDIKKIQGQIEITIQDQGPGIPMVEREQIFQAFHRLSDSLTDSGTGTGIGLTISRALARLHNGDLLLDKSETGACFRVILGELKKETS
ncbi:MAG: HAMP domain-containing histidine kinase [Candidatus Lindowbacteria bacterium]|nr:HAMP domain-containing histidine kinase [Candidatus Lindowbacteria bacterium]